MNAKPDFSDLIPRIFSAFFLILVGLGCMWSGGYAFSFFLIITTGLMAWETSRMHSDQQIIPFLYGLIIGTIALAIDMMEPEIPITSPASFGFACLAKRELKHGMAREIPKLRK